MCLSAITDWMTLLCLMCLTLSIQSFILPKESRCLGRCKPGDGGNFLASLNLMITTVMKLWV